MSGDVDRDESLPIPAVLAFLEPYRDHTVTEFLETYFNDVVRKPD